MAERRVKISKAKYYEGVHSYVPVEQYGVQVLQMQVGADCRLDRAWRSILRGPKWISFIVLEAKSHAKRATQSGIYRAKTQKYNSAKPKKKQRC